MKLQTKKIITSLAVLGVLVSPVLALGYESPGTPAEVTLDAFITNILKLVWEITAGLAAIMFIVAGILFITAQGDPTKLGTARQALIWAVVGVAVAIIAFSLVKIITGAFTATSYNSTLV